MGYGILRIEKIKMAAGGELYGRARHNCREYQPNKEPENIDPEKTKENLVFGAENIAEVQKKVKELWGKTTGSPRSDAVGLLEAVVTLSGGNLSPERTAAFLKASRSFLEGLYGPDKVIGVYIHADEKTPHLHAFIVPLEEKEVRKKQTTEEKKAGIWRKEKKTVLNAQKVMGSRETLRKLQDQFFEKVSSSFGLERGEPAEETKAKHRRPSIREEEKSLVQEKKNLRYMTETLIKQKKDLDMKEYTLEKTEKALDKQKFELSEKKHILESEKKNIDTARKNLETRYEHLMTIPIGDIKLSHPVPGETSEKWLTKNALPIVTLHRRAQKAEAALTGKRQVQTKQTPQPQKKTEYDGYDR
jgi:hypothetical protein